MDCVPPRWRALATEILEAIPTLFGMPVDRLLQRREFILMVCRIMEEEGYPVAGWIALLPQPEDEAYKTPQRAEMQRQ